MYLCKVVVKNLRERKKKKIQEVIEKVRNSKANDTRKG